MMLLMWRERSIIVDSGKIAGSERSHLCGEELSFGHRHGPRMQKDEERKDEATGMQ